VTEAVGFAPGTPCWLDVSTSDPAGSRDFYAGLLGWSYRMDPDPASGHYTYALLDDRPVAGLAGVPAQPGQPIVWTLYLATANITHTAAAVEQLGGQVLYGPVAIPEQGSMLVGADSTGAVLGFWQPPAGWVFRSQEIGTLCWAELNTWDGAAADAFFGRMFGYSHDLVDDSYTTWALGERVALGRRRMGPEFDRETAPHWVPYFAVDPDTGADTATARARELGGRVRVDPYDTGLGRTAVVEDPFGALFALIDPSRRPELTPGDAEFQDPHRD